MLRASLFAPSIGVSIGFMASGSQFSLSGCNYLKQPSRKPIQIAGPGWQIKTSRAITSLSGSSQSDHLPQNCEWPDDASLGLMTLVYLWCRWWWRSALYSKWEHQMEIVSDVFVFAICSGQQWARSRKLCPLCFQRICKFRTDNAGVYASDYRTPMALDFWA